MNISLWVFKIRGFEGGIGVSKHGGPRNSSRVELLINQTSKISIMFFWLKILCGCLDFEGLKVELGFKNVGDPLIPLGWGC
jgi:hypothetical protein